MLAPPRKQNVSGGKLVGRLTSPAALDPRVNGGQMRQLLVTKPYSPDMGIAEVTVCFAADAEKVTAWDNGRQPAFKHRPGEDWVTAREIASILGLDPEPETSRVPSWLQATAWT
jgi:hypothetical protein